MPILGPPGQNTQVPWGHAKGAEKAVTTTIPEALLLGWTRSISSKSDLAPDEREAIISELVTYLFRENSEDVRFFSFSSWAREPTFPWETWSPMKAIAASSLSFACSVTGASSSGLACA